MLRKLSFAFVITTALVSLFQLISHWATRERLTFQTVSDSALRFSTHAPTLSFDVCNGFGNQQLSIAYGIIIAIMTGRHVILPDLVTDGEQLTSSIVASSAANTSDFSSFFDQRAFTADLKRIIGVSIKKASYRKKFSLQSVDIEKIPSKNVIPFLSNMHEFQLIHISCPLFKLPPDIFKNYTLVHAFNTILTTLVPNRKWTNLIKSIPKRLNASTSYINVLHLRLESDWISHCKRWTGDNCVGYTDTLDSELSSFSFSPDVPLLVTFDYPNDEIEATLVKLKKKFKKILLFNDVFVTSHELPREIRALLIFYLALDCNNFIGNSVSTFSALLIARRRLNNLRASYYNGGNVPLTSFLPFLLKMPWVFTYNKKNAGTEFEILMKAAVISGKRSYLKPYCLYLGSSREEVTDWMVSQGVTVIYHSPLWTEQLINLAMQDSDQHSSSHNYKTNLSLTSTFQRIDLPITDALRQYTYVLYTDTDVYFRQEITLDSFGLPLPQTISMAWERDPIFPYNAGVMLANLQGMRKVHSQFMAMLLDSDISSGLYYPGYGPLDQGILNKFYEKDLRAKVLDEKFNAKPYKDLNPRAHIVHFQGPKPSNFLSFLVNGTCQFGSMCSEGIDHAATTYLMEWSRFVGKEEREYSFQLPHILQAQRKED